ncbi:MAG: hypothetical protein ACRECQ_16910 [Burkholderiaceae bacterium]
MPIRGDRLRWPPRPGKKSSEKHSGGTRSTLAGDEQLRQPLRSPDERDESADRQTTSPRKVIKQAHDDLKQGQQDTDCHSQTAEVLDLESDRSRATPLRDDTDR